MKIYRPVKENFKFQAFGENDACALLDDNGKIVRPFSIKGKTNGKCPAGYGEFYTAIGLRGHPGEDWGAVRGDEVFFNVDIPDMKWWARVEVDEAQGINLDVFSLDPVPFDELPPETSPHAKELWLSQDKKIHVMFRYSHGFRVFLDDKPKIQIGVLADGSPQMAPEIKLGDRILLADSTGASSGDHLHWAMKFRFKNSMVAGNDNGYMGAVPYDKWFVNVFVRDLFNDPIPSYKFLNNLEYGKKSLENIKLQEKLKALGFMPKEISTSENYGPQTLKAVAAFQKAHNIFSISPGRYCHAKTREKLNAIV